MKNLFFGIVLGGIISSIIWYFQTGKPQKNMDVIEKAKPAISDFLDTTKSMAGISNVIIDKDSAKKYIANYVADHDTSKDSKVTLSIYFDRGTCEFIANYYLKFASPDVQGIRIYNIQYNKKMDRETNNSHKDPKQQSLVMVPTDKFKKPLWDEWDVKSFPSPFQNYLGALNHGELCPKICPQ